MLLMYASAIFYSIDTYPPMIQRVFLINPVYVFIKYFRCIVLYDSIPSLGFHAYMLLVTAVAVGLGGLIYKKYNTRFLYYL